MLDTQEYRKRKCANESSNNNVPSSKWRVTVSYEENGDEKMARIAGPFKNYLVQAPTSTSKIAADEDLYLTDKTNFDDKAGPSGINKMKSSENIESSTEKENKPTNSETGESGVSENSSDEVPIKIDRQEKLVHIQDQDSKSNEMTSLECSIEKERTSNIEPDSKQLSSSTNGYTINSDPYGPDEQVGEKTPHSNKLICTDNDSGTESVKDALFDGVQNRLNAALSPQPLRVRNIPIPCISWTDNVELSSLMCFKEDISLKERYPNIFRRNPHLNPRMRAILFDWIIEVCEVYKLRRVTYYLAIDYIDRYLSKTRVVPKHQLQLLGITSLFIASKVEEIYPPKLLELAYVTDGACTEQDMLTKEMEILKELRWDVNPMTVTGWLSLYLQLCSSSLNIREAENKLLRVDDFVYPQFSPYIFMRASQIIDLCSLDDGMLRFNYSVIAASIIYFLYNRETALHVSGYVWNKISNCVSWMRPFVLVVNRSQQTNPIIAPKEYNFIASGLRRLNPNIVLEEGHTIQNHFVNLNMLEEVYTLVRELNEEKSVASAEILHEDYEHPYPQASDRSEGDNRHSETDNHSELGNARNLRVHRESYSEATDPGSESSPVPQSTCSVSENEEFSNDDSATSDVITESKNSSKNTNENCKRNESNKSKIGKLESHSNRRKIQICRRRARARAQQTLPLIVQELPSP